MAKLSNAFQQGRHINIDTENYHKPVEKYIKEAKEKHIPLKRVASIAQATANIKSKNSKPNVYYNKVAKEARYLGHKSRDGYSLHYPRAEERKIAQAAGHQARLAG
jgi:hypothetical protein